MPRYTVTRRYGTSLYGPWQPGTEVDLDVETATWVNRDSDGVLVLVEPPEEPTGPAVVESSQKPDEATGGPQGAAPDPAPPVNRQHRASKRRAQQ